MNFHPDQEVDGVAVTEMLAGDGVYRSQFEAGTSNGGLTAHPGGQRSALGLLVVVRYWPTGRSAVAGNGRLSQGK